MPAQAGAEVVIVSLGSTEGLRRADDELAQMLRGAGAAVTLARARAPRRRLPTLMLTDLAWALAARAAARAALAGLSGPPRAIVYSSTTAALLWPRPGAIRFDAPASANRPGRHGLWQRPLERRRLDQASLLLPWSDGALQEVPPAVVRGDRAIVLPVAVDPSPAPAASDRDERDIAVLTYAANPLKKGLDRVLAAWTALAGTRARQRGEELLIAGTDERELARAGVALAGVPGARLLGRLGTGEYRALLRRARVFACAPRREDYGLAQLEALADGAQLVTTPAPGPYAALPIARALDPRLVTGELSAGLAAALLDPAPGYATRAAELLQPYSPAAVEAVVCERLLPRLLA
jgi:hypothetical protein